MGLQERGLRLLELMHRILQMDPMKSTRPTELKRWND